MVSNKTLNVKIQNRYDEAQFWSMYNPVLLRGELGISKQLDGSVVVKVGDGVSPFSNLPQISGGGGTPQIDGFRFQVQGNDAIIYTTGTATATYDMKLNAPNISTETINLTAAGTANATLKAGTNQIWINSVDGIEISTGYGNVTIKNLVRPTDDNDAANKIYVDQLIQASLPTALSDLNNDMDFLSSSQIDSEIDNKIALAVPTALSDLTNDTNFISSSEIDSKISQAVSSVYKPKGTKATYHDLPGFTAQGVIASMDIVGMSIDMESAGNYTFGVHWKLNGSGDVTLNPATHSKQIYLTYVKENGTTVTSSTTYLGYGPGWNYSNGAWENSVTPSYAYPTIDFTNGIITEADANRIIANASDKSVIYATVQDITDWDGVEYIFDPTQAGDVGDVWNVADTGMNYAWTGGSTAAGWDALGSVVDTSQFIKGITGTYLIITQDADAQTYHITPYTASTSQYGMVRLSNTYTSSSSTYAATQTAVYNAYTQGSQRANSSNTISKLYLIGATSQGTGQLTYSNNQVYMQNGKLYIDSKQVAVKDDITGFDKFIGTVNAYENLPQPQYSTATLDTYRPTSVGATGAWTYNTTGQYWQASIPAIITVDPTIDYTYATYTFIPGTNFSAAYGDLVVNAQVLSYDFHSKPYSIVFTFRLYTSHNDSSHNPYTIGSSTGEGIEIKATRIVSGNIAFGSTYKVQSNGMGYIWGGNGWNSVGRKVLNIDVTLPAAGWSSGKTQTVSVNGVKDSDTVIVSPKVNGASTTQTNMDTWVASEVYCKSIPQTGSIEFACNQIPTEAVVASVVIIGGDENDN